MSVGIESLFTSALGLQAPWSVKKVELDTARRRIDFELTCNAKRLACPHCDAPEQGVHDRLRRQWRHLDFFQFEAWLHAEVPRIACNACGQTSQIEVPWARAGSGFTALFEALALSLCQELPVRQAAALLRCSDKQLWRRIEHYVSAARKLDDMSQVTLVGIDETSLRKGQNYITVVHDLNAKRLLYACEGRDHQTVVDFATELKAHGGEPAQIEHVCQDMSAAYAKGVGVALPQAQISYDRFLVIAMAHEAMDNVRRTEMSTQPQAVKQALGEIDQQSVCRVILDVDDGGNGQPLVLVHRSSLMWRRQHATHPLEIYRLIYHASTRKILRQSGPRIKSPAGQSAPRAMRFT
jgi:transposase